MNYLQTSASHRSPAVGQGQTLEFPPCSSFSIQHCSSMTRRGQHSTAQRHWVPFPTGYPGSGDTDSTKHHQLSPDSVQIQFQTPVPWDLEAPTEPLFCLFSHFGCTGSLLRCVGLAAPECYEILVPDPGVEPESTALEGGFLTTGPLAKSLGPFILKLRPSPPVHLAV